MRNSNPLLIMRLPCAGRQAGGLTEFFEGKSKWFFGGRGKGEGFWKKEDHNNNWNR